jgi:hypothetical protein
MAEGHGWGGASHAGSNHPALASASAAPPYPGRGALSRTYVVVYSNSLHWSPLDCFHDDYNPDRRSESSFHIRKSNLERRLATPPAFDP